MCSECIIPYKGFAAAMPVDIAQKCLPLWLEAAGWVVATAVDATAAAVGTWPQQGQQEPTGSSTSSTQDGQVCCDGVSCLIEGQDLVYVLEWSGCYHLLKGVRTIPLHPERPAGPACLRIDNHAFLPPMPVSTSNTTRCRGPEGRT